MINAIVRFSIRERVFVLIFALLLVSLGIWSATRLPVDAVPDITNRQVQVNTNVPGMGPQNVERQVTFPLETALAGLPHVKLTRSISQYALSQITVVFDSDVNIYFARQLVNERLQSVVSRLPSGIRPEMGPVSTGLGEILYIRLAGGDYSLMKRRTVMDWIVAPQLRTVPGLADVNIWGGLVKQYQVRLNPNKLIEYGVSIHQVDTALARNNQNAGGNYITHGGEQELVETEGMLRSRGDIRDVVVTAHEGVPVTVAQLGSVAIGPAIRDGAITQDGKKEQVYAIALLLMGHNGGAVVQRIKAKLKQIQPSLPSGMRLVTFLDRSKLIDRTVHTAMQNLVEGGILVVLVLFLFLLQMRAGLIVSSAIPMAMLCAIIGMKFYGVSANLMSLGAIDFGMIVDGAVIIVENCVRRLAEHCQTQRRELTEPERLQTIYDATVEVRRASQFGELIIISAYLPILSLAGVEGRMFRPMGMTVILALIGALILSLTLIPALCAFFLRARAERPNPVLERISISYQPLLEKSMRYRYVTVGGALVFCILCGVLFTHLGSEFIPNLDEGALLIETRYPPTISLNEVIRRTDVLERTALQQFPDEINQVVGRVGHAEIATEPQLTNQADIILTLKPRGQWKQARTQNELTAKMAKALGHLPGVSLEFGQPIKDRMEELLQGIGMRGDLSINIFGPDRDVLAQEAKRAAAIVSSVRGSADVLAQTTQGLPLLNIRILRRSIALYGISIADVNSVVQAAVGGKEVTTLTRGVERFAVVTRMQKQYRNNAQTIGRILVPSPEGIQIPLQQLADISEITGPVQISHENGQRFVGVLANVRGRDLGGFVEAVQKRLASRLHLPAGYHIEYGGAYRQLKEARARLSVVTPLTFVFIFLLLFATFGSLRQAALVFTGVPLAITGGVLALLLRGMPFSISAGVGFIALFGVAALNGLVLVTFINHLRAQGTPVREAVLKGARTRLRPILMTAAVAGIGFIPMAISHSAGARVQRPLATVVIGGLITSTLLTLFVLPTLYAWFERDSPEAAETT